MELGILEQSLLGIHWHLLAFSRRCENTRRLRHATDGTALGGRSKIRLKRIGSVLSSSVFPCCFAEHQTGPVLLALDEVNIIS